MKKTKKRKKTLNLFIWMFITLFLFNTIFTWINFYQFKTNSENHQNDMSLAISSDIKNRYESVSSFIETMDPYISQTVEKSLYSIEREINANNRKIDNDVLESLQAEYNLTNIYVLDKDGIVQYSTDKREIGKYSREFYNETDKKKWETAFKRIVTTEEVYIEDKFYRSEMNPYRYHKWGYKGIGYVDGLGLVVLEVGIQVLDIKNDSITPLVNQVIDLDKVNENIISIEFKNLPPTESKKAYKEEQYVDENNNIITKINALGLDDADVQITVITNFKSTQNNIDNAFENALIWTIFYIICSFLLCFLLYYRFSLPMKYVRYEELEEKINQLNELKNK